MNPWEPEIVQALVGKVRVLSVKQIQRGWWSTARYGRRQANKSILRLRDGGWIAVRRVLARPIVQLFAPIYCWRPGDKPPNVDQLSKSLHQRAHGFASVTTICCATIKARSFFGAASTAGQFKLTQITHDLHVSGVFLKYRSDGLDVFRWWVGEDMIPGAWRQAVRPDALLLNDVGDIDRAIEYGGDYTSQRLESLHREFSKINLAYELW